MHAQRARALTGEQVHNLSSLHHTHHPAAHCQTLSSPPKQNCFYETKGKNYVHRVSNRPSGFASSKPEALFSPLWKKPLPNFGFTTVSPLLSLQFPLIFAQSLIKSCVHCDWETPENPAVGKGYTGSVWAAADDIATISTVFTSLFLREPRDFCHALKWPH